MSWDRTEFSLHCEKCGHTGKEIVRENDWMQSETHYEGFDRLWVEGSHPGMKDAHGDFEAPLCPNCGRDGRVIRSTPI